MIQLARLAHWKCWIETKTHQSALMSTQMNPLIQQSEMAGTRFTSTLVMIKRFQSCWLWLNILLRMKLPDCRDTTPTLHRLLYRLQICCSKPTVTQTAGGKRHTASSLWPVTTQQGHCPVDPCSLWARRKRGGRPSCKVWQWTRATQPGNLLWRGQSSDQAAF